MNSDSGKYSGFGYPDIRIPVENTIENHRCPVKDKIYISFQLISDPTGYSMLKFFRFGVHL